MEVRRLRIVVATRRPVEALATPQSKLQASPPRRRRRSGARRAVVRFERDRAGICARTFRGAEHSRERRAGARRKSRPGDAFLARARYANAKGARSTWVSTLDYPPTGPSQASHRDLCRRPLDLRAPARIPEAVEARPWSRERTNRRAPRRVCRRDTFLTTNLTHKPRENGGAHVGSAGGVHHSVLQAVPRGRPASSRPPRRP
ncbi:MAG: hypothetical protein RLZZ450_3310 [Pseudomonadota bacterium]|jgi:hypothetical protein